MSNINQATFRVVECQTCKEKIRVTPGEFMYCRACDLYLNADGTRLGLGQLQALTHPDMDLVDNIVAGPGYATSFQHSVSIGGTSINPNRNAVTYEVKEEWI